MSTCQCGRVFKSEAALRQHQAAKHSSEPPAQPNNATSQQITPTPGSLSRNTRSREVQLWKGLRSREPVHIIDSAALQPSAAPVSSATPCELICSYNWQNSGEFHVPGHAPLWQDVALPVTIPKDQKNSSTSKSGWHKAKYPFEQVFQAAAFMSPDFRFNNVDIVVTRNSLRKLLDFCGGRNQQTFRVNLSLSQNTLFIEQYDTKFMAFQASGWGHNFEKAFTRFPAGLEASTSHDRFLRYPIGELNSVVGFEVDASYGGESDEFEDAKQPFELLRTGMEELSLKTPPRPLDQMAKAKIMPQSTAAELKSSMAKRTGISAYLPQLWFGRTPWLIVGSHTEGTFHEIRITDAAAHFARWEAERQFELRKLVTVLAGLREVARRNKGRGCAAIYEKDASSRVLKIYALEKGGAGFPSRFWC